MFWLLVIIWIIFMTRDKKEQKDKDARFEQGEYYGPAAIPRQSYENAQQQAAQTGAKSGDIGYAGPAQGQARAGQQAQRAGQNARQAAQNVRGGKRKSELVKLILGALSLVGGVDELSELISGGFAGSEPMDLITAIILIGIGAAAIAVAIHNMNIYNVAEGVVRKDGNTSIDHIAQAIKKPYDKTVAILSAMLRKNYFPNAYIDYQNRLLVMTKNGQPIEPVKPYEGAVCPHCSGPVGEGDIFCMHCGKRIKDEATVRAEEEKAREKAKAEEKTQFLTELDRLIQEVDEQEFTGKLVELKSVTGKINEKIEEDPESEASFRKFVNIYMPAIVNAVGTYRDVRTADCSIDEKLESRRDALDAVDMGLSASRKLLDQLYQSDQLSVAVDLEMLRRMMAADGLLQDENQMKMD